MKAAGFLVFFFWGVLLSATPEVRQVIEKDVDIDWDRPQQMVMHPNGRFLVVIDRTLNLGVGFARDSFTGALTLVQTTPLIQLGDDDPRDADFSKSGRWFYVLGSHSLTVYEYQEDLNQIQWAQVFEDDSIGGSFANLSNPVSLFVDPDPASEFIYVLEGASGTIFRYDHQGDFSNMIEAGSYSNQALFEGYVPTKLKASPNGSSSLYALHQFDGAYSRVNINGENNLVCSCVVFDQNDGVPPSIIPFDMTFSSYRFNYLVGNPFETTDPWLLPFRASVGEVIAAGDTTSCEAPPALTPGNALFAPKHKYLYAANAVLGGLDRFSVLPVSGVPVFEETICLPDPNGGFAPPTNVVSDPDGRHLYVSSYRAGHVYVLETEPQTAFRTLAEQWPETSFAEMLAAFPQPPEVALFAEIDGLDVTFSVQVEDEDSDTFFFQLQTGDFFYEGNNFFPRLHTYGEAGNYLVQLTVVDDQWNRSTASLAVVVPGP